MSSSLRPFFSASERTCFVISLLSCWSKAISCELRAILSPFDARMVLRAARISWIFLICNFIALESSLPSTPLPAPVLLCFCSLRTLSCLSNVCVSVCMSLVSCSVTCVICCFIARTLLYDSISLLMRVSSSLSLTRFALSLSRVRPFFFNSLISRKALPHSLNGLFLIF